ncbi:MAG TPA: HAMP domain-containing sensor histidine kinase [Desulfuromonadaceae bacterium]
MTDDELLTELAKRFSQSEKAFSDLGVLSLKLLEMNQRLEASEALKTNFLSNIRNEIVNPLNSIIGLAGQILHLKDEKDISQIVSMICSEANNLDFQLRNIFIAAALEAGDVDPKIVRVNVNAIIRNVIDSFFGAAVSKSVVITLDVPDNDIPILLATDSEKLEIIFANLLSNAIEFSPPGGVVTVALKLNLEGWLVLTVSDCGAGIAAEDQKRMFDRFTQLDTGTTRSHHGHGLGLCITSSLLELLGGSVMVQSTPGEGAAFSVTLPPFNVFDGEDTFSENDNLFFFDDMSEK